MTFRLPFRDRGRQPMPREKRAAQGAGGTSGANGRLCMVGTLSGGRWRAALAAIPGPRRFGRCGRAPSSTSGAAHPGRWGRSRRGLPRNRQAGPGALGTPERITAPIVHGGPLPADLAGRARVTGPPGPGSSEGRRMIPHPLPAPLGRRVAILVRPCLSCRRHVSHAAAARPGRSRPCAQRRKSTSERLASRAVSI